MSYMSNIESKECTLNVLYWIDIDTIMLPYKILQVKLEIKFVLKLFS